MGIRFRRSVKIAPGVKVNVGKKSAGVTVGGKHGRVTVNSNKKVSVGSSVPGTGIYYSKQINNNSNNKGKSAKQTDLFSPGKLIAYIILCTVFFFSSFTVEGAFAKIFFLVIDIALIALFVSKKKQKNGQNSNTLE